MNRTRILVGLLALAVTTLTFASGQQATDENGLIPVHFAADGFLLGAQSWVAAEKGYFADEGLDARVSLFGTGIDAINAVIAQQADLGPGLDFAVLNLAAAAAENMQVVACIAAPAPGFHQLAVRNDINEPRDLLGKKIGYVAGTSEHLVTIRYLEQNGVGLDEVELIPFPGLFEMVGALRTNDIQASWVWLSGTQEAREDPNLKILTDDSAVLDTLAIYLVTRSDWADANKDTIERVVRAYDNASRAIANDVTEAAQIIGEGVSGNAEMFATMIPNQNYRIGFDQVQLDSFDSIAQFLIDTGKLDPDFDIRDFINFDAMERAVPGSVTADLN